MTSRACLAEAFATFLLVVIGAGSVLAGGSRLEIALAHGLALMAGIYAIAGISGAHINPAVSVAMWATKKMKGQTAAYYIIAQLIGAAVAGYALLVVFGNPAVAVNRLSPGITVGEGLLTEAILTAILVFVIFATAIHQKSEHAGFVIGGYLAAAHLVALEITGSSLNPARTFGPALASGFWTNHIVYWVGPIVGAVIAGLVYQSFFMKKEAKGKK